MAKTGFNKEYEVTPELKVVVGKSQASRPEVTKRVWEYIRRNNLQDRTNRRVINPDAVLGAVLGKKPIDMFKMTKKVSEHLLAPAD